jgi:putative spermidine/putrescine transport system permease protein
VEAARNLGAGLATTLLRVVLPAIRSAVLGAAFLTLALVLGEIVIARILLYTDTFPVAIVEVGRSQAGVAVALSLASLLVTWVLLLAVSLAGVRRRRAERTP